jgi:hypothetical protein
MSVKTIIGRVNFLAAIALLTLAYGGLAIAGGPNPGPCAVCGHVPELEPHMIGTGLTVFGGAAALLLERYRRRKR